MTKTEANERMKTISESLFLEFRSFFTTMTNSLGTHPELTGIREGEDISTKIGMTTYPVPPRNQPAFLLIRDEVKAQNGFLRKDFTYNRNEISGTIGFEVFSNWYQNPEERWKAYPGWLLSLFNPDMLQRIKAARGRPETVTQPTTIDFFLFDGATIGEEKPFACVSFESIDLLIQRIRECLPAEWNLESWNLPPLNEKDYWRNFMDVDGKQGYCTNWNRNNGGMIGNMWHIPFRRLADIATVTMIGDDPEAVEGLHKTRLQWLKDYAIQPVFDSRDGTRSFEERRLTHEKALGFRATVREYQKTGKSYRGYNTAILTPATQEIYKRFTA